MEEYDIIYILKNDVQADELRYSLRSVVKNFPYSRIIFYGGCPEGIIPDKWFYYRQSGTGKISRVVYTISDIIKNDKVSDNFWLFNDDFFIFKPYDFQVCICEADMFDTINRIERSRGGRPSKYTRILRSTANELKNRNCDTVGYATHTPILINKQKAKYIIDTFPNEMSFRCAYGNYYKLPYIVSSDVKIINTTAIPKEDACLVSTNDKSFRFGKVGEFVRNTFSEPCKYEQEW